MHITCFYTFAAPAISLPKAGTCRHIIQLFHGKLWLEEAAQAQWCTVYTLKLSQKGPHYEIGHSGEIKQ